MVISSLTNLKEISFSPFSPIRVQFEVDLSSSLIKIHCASAHRDVLSIRGFIEPR